jgi:hypothetical protein
MERLIIKEPHISPPDNQEIGKTLIVLYVVNVVSKDLKSDLVCVSWLHNYREETYYLLAQYLVCIFILICIYIYIIRSSFFLNLV